MSELPPSLTGGRRSREVSAYSRDHLQMLASDLVINGSIELSTQAGSGLPDALELLPYGMAVYVPKLLKRSLADSVEHIRTLHAAGFDAVPHIAARQVLSKEVLAEFLEHVVRHFGVHRVLLIGGDNPKASGPFPDSAALLRSGILPEYGIHEVDIAAYPEGHPRIPSAVLTADLETKLKLASQQGLGLSIITQFSFVPSRIIEYCDKLAHIAPQIPVYVGIAGPTDAASLMRFARHCGVSEAIRALISLGVNAAKLASHTDPDEQIDVLARYCAGHEACNLIGVHVFSFGGFASSARWMHEKFPHAPTKPG